LPLSTPVFVPKEVRLSGGVSLRLESRTRYGEHEWIKRSQHKNGVRILGAQILEVRGGADQTKSIYDQRVTLDLETEPTISRATALLLSDPGASSAELLILPHSDRLSGRLIYSVHTPEYTAWIDAHSGKTIARIPHLQAIAPIKVYTAEHLPFQGAHPQLGPLQLPLEKYALASPEDLAAQQAQRNSERVLTYFYEKHGRDSYDGAGATLNAIVHIGVNMANAFWDHSRKVIGYGDGDGKILGSFTRAIDVAGHESTHSIVSSTSKLTYIHESGAINEGLSDFFGAIIEGKNNWIMGEDLHLNDDAVKGIRDVANPGSRSERIRDEEFREITVKYPATVSEAMVFDLDDCGWHNDLCGVHLNSTVVSHAGYRLIKAIGHEATEKLFYLAMTQFLTETSSFKDFGQAVRDACGVAITGEALEKTCTQVDATLKELGL
jgi:Zn-dependent metalloprotease